MTPFRKFTFMSWFFFFLVFAAFRVSAAELEPDSLPGLVWVAEDHLDLRSEPHPDATILKTLERGIPLRVEKKERNWLRVVDPTQIQGWVSGTLKDNAISNPPKKSARPPLSAIKPKKVAAVAKKRSNTTAHPPIPVKTPKKVAVTAKKGTTARAYPLTPVKTPKKVVVTAKKETTARARPWFVQVAAFFSRKPAEQLAKKLEKKGFSTRIVEKLRKSGRAAFFVRIGAYQTQQEAQLAHTMLFEKEKKAGLIVHPHLPPNGT